MNQSWKIPRRSFLKGAGTLGISILLPQLDVMEAAAAVDSSSPRFIAIFNSLGTYGMGYDGTKNNASRYFYADPWGSQGMGVWVPKTTGLFSAALPPALQPLEALKQKISILSGLGTLVSDEANNSTNHSCATTAWLTSAYSSRADATAKNIAADGSRTAKNNAPPDSLDQAIANYLGITAGSSLVFCPHTGDYSESGQGGHGGYISYNSKLAGGGSTLVPKSADPKKAFNSLFGNCTSTPAPPAVDAGKKSILDYVMGSISSLQNKVSAADKVRLDSYLQNIRDIEKRLTASTGGGGGTTCPSAPAASPAYTGGGLDWVTTVNMMADVICLAVASGRMPVASLMTDREAEGAPNHAERVSFLSSYVGINGQKVAYHSSALNTHFDITHVEGEGSNVQAIEEHIAYTQMNMTFTKRIIQTLNSMPVEPNGFTPLDNTVVLSGACHSHSGYHVTHNLPTLIAGGRKFGLNQGRHIAFPQMTDIGNLYFSIMKAMGIPVNAFNGNSKILTGVFG